tara:strand:+ start:72 stop:455 length:384 start_codon:yes stop_codon:yes gene_type:complete
LLQYRSFYIIFYLLIAYGCSKTESKKFSIGSPESKGLDIFNRMACNACHSIDGSLKLGPSMKNQYGKEIRHTDGSIAIIDDNYIRESLTDPLKHIVEGYTPIMPSYKPILKEEDFINLIAFIKTLDK